jgi:predicted GNAT superfamily acetyltransferase
MATGQAAGAGRPVSADSIDIRRCHQLDDLRACVALQKEVWNFSDAELVPLRMFVVAEKVGGQVIGAFAGKEMVGFALSVPGARGGHSYLHSQMLAVRKQHQNAGLGRRIKFFQRDDALARGFELIEWTFDPLEIKNAYLNIEKLGAIARRYSVNQYGITSSPLQGGLPTDRLVAEWWLKSRRVESLLQAGRNPRVETLSTISVPGQIYDWKASSTTRSQAKEVQDRNREQFVKAFADGLTVLGYERDQQRNGNFLPAGGRKNGYMPPPKFLGFVPGVDRIRINRSRDFEEK